MFRELLVGIDGSEESRKAADRAIELAALADGRLHGIYIREMVPTYTKKGAVILQQDAEQEAEEEYAHQILDEIAADARDANVPFEGHIDSGVPSFVLSEHAKQHDIDAIVVGTRGRTGLRELVVGSTTERTLRSSPVTVIAVR